MLVIERDPAVGGVKSKYAIEVIAIRIAGVVQALECIQGSLIKDETGVRLIRCHYSFPNSIWRKVKATRHGKQAVRLEGIGDWSFSHTLTLHELSAQEVRGLGMTSTVGLVGSMIFRGDTQRLATLEHRKL